MKRIDVTRVTAPAILRVGLVIGYLAGAGCTDSPSSNRTDNPALKASLEKHVEIYKAKTQGSKQGKSPAPTTRP